jgi:hypothetical protein
MTRRGPSPYPTITCPCGFPGQLIEVRHTPYDVAHGRPASYWKVNHEHGQKGQWFSTCKWANDPREGETEPYVDPWEKNR